MKTIVNKNISEKIPDAIPVIPTMDVVVFPHTIVPLLVLDEKIINGINKSLQESKTVLLLAAKNQTLTHNHQTIGTQDLYSIGTIASIMRLIHIAEGGIKILVQGIAKARVIDILTEPDYLYAAVETLAEYKNLPSLETEVEIKNIKSLAEKMAITGTHFSPDFHVIISKMNNAEKIADFILSHLTLTVAQAQELLEMNCIIQLLQKLHEYLNKEIEVAELQEKVRNNARESMTQSQKEFFLREQLRAIKKELGEDETEEIEVMRKQLDALPVSDELRIEIGRQLNRLERIAPDSMEAAVTRGHLEWIFALPWGKHSVDNLDVSHAKHVLDEEHYGLKEIKERILDFISIKNLKSDGFSPILCFVGPPGTGKTSLGKSIAQSLGRSYARISLGGVKDEAEIRGHRRTYVGAMPGRFIQAIRKAGTCNPVVVIDELDKIGADFRGDPSAAMLEVLDPQQNRHFYDNYLGIPFDLSHVMFIATANNIASLSEPLRDRLEVIELSGYTLDEKIGIAQRHLLQKSRESAGLIEYDIPLETAVLEDIVTNYTKESGVRQLERLLNKLYSKAARALVETKKVLSFSCQTIDQYLGPRKYLDDDHDHKHQIGISNGLAWTNYGGQVLKIEAVLMPGKGKLILTGQLGNIMKESAQAALSYARAHAAEFDIPQSTFVHYDLHIHVPAGSIPKDGPSAGITMLASILSALTNRPIDCTYAMTGELNLRGEVMPIGGVKEKILAAKRQKIEFVILPHKNKPDLVGAEDITKDISIIWVDHADQVLHRVLMQKHK